MNTEHFLAETFKDGQEVTVNANELQALIREKRSLSREVIIKNDKIALLEVALTSNREKYSETYNSLLILESKLNYCNNNIRVDLKV